MAGHLPTWLGKENGWGRVRLGPYLPGWGSGAVVGPLGRGEGGSPTYLVGGRGWCLPLPEQNVRHL